MLVICSSLWIPFGICCCLQKPAAPLKACVSLPRICKLSLVLSWMHRSVKAPAAEAVLPEFDLVRKVGRKIALQRFRSAVILCVVDVADFDGSLPRDAIQSLLPQSEQPNPPGYSSSEAPMRWSLVIAANKADLLPVQAKPQRLEVRCYAFFVVLFAFNSSQVKTGFEPYAGVYGMLSQSSALNTTQLHQMRTKAAEPIKGPQSHMGAPPSVGLAEARLAVLFNQCRDFTHAWLHSGLDKASPGTGGLAPPRVCAACQLSQGHWRA